MTLGACFELCVAAAAVHVDVVDANAAAGCVVTAAGKRVLGVADADVAAAAAVGVAVAVAGVDVCGVRAAAAESGTGQEDEGCCGKSQSTLATQRTDSLVYRPIC